MNPSRDLCNRAYPPHPDWFHIATAAQRLKVRPGEILGLAVGNVPDWLGKLAGTDGYEAIAINILAVAKLFYRGPVAGMSVEAFAKSYGLKPRAAMILVRGGHVPSVMERNPKTGQHQPLLTPASITAFQQRFARLRTLARQLGRSWQDVLRDLEAANVAPFLPEGHDIGSVYEWSALERNGYCRPNIYSSNQYLESHGRAAGRLCDCSKGSPLATDFCRKVSLWVSNDSHARPVQPHFEKPQLAQVMQPSTIRRS